MEESEPQTQIQINEWKLAGCLFKAFYLKAHNYSSSKKKKKFIHYSQFLPNKSKWLDHTDDSSRDSYSM